MRPSARFQTLVDLLTPLTEASPPAADQWLTAYLRPRHYIGSGDRRFVTEHYWQLLRHFLPLGWWCARFGLLPEGRGRVLMAMRLLWGYLPEAITTLADGSSHGLQALTSAEHAAITAAAPPLRHADMPPHTAHNLLEWSHQLLASTYAEGATQLLAALEEPAPTTLRANRLLTTRSRVMAELASAGIAAEASPHTADAIYLTSRQPVTQLPAFKRGWFELQDEASQVIALATQAKPGMRVVDLCAGAGGKTLAMAAMMQNKGEIIACDVDATRLENLTHRAQRAGVTIIRPLVCDATSSPPLPEAQADIVLVDAPCSGSGTWRRAPDSRWRYSQQAMEGFYHTQQAMLASAHVLLKPLGRLVYATCSLYPTENHQQVERFANEYQYIEGASWKGALSTPSWITEKTCTTGLQFLPHLHKTDGMYLAVLHRQAIQ